jgi:hypothetical protein
VIALPVRDPWTSLGSARRPAHRRRRRKHVMLRSFVIGTPIGLSAHSPAESRFSVE